jgi:hypothetical protein
VSALSSEITALEAKIKDQQQQVRRAQRAAEQFAQLKQRSLPGDAEVARSLYKAWLIDLAEKQIKLNDPIVAPGSISPGKVYQRIGIAIGGRGTLPQLTELLHAIYSVDYLHQIRSLRVKPVPDSKLLEISLGMDALVVAGADPAHQLTPKPSARLGGRKLADFQKLIFERNLFGPENHAPQIADLSRQRAETGKTFTLAVKATDADPLDKISFRLAEDAPPEAKINSTGELRFQSKQKGTFQLTVIASDDGLPVKSSQRRIEITVADPPPRVVANNNDRPPPPPQAYFGDGELTFVTGITEINGRREVWLNVRTTGETMKLNEGEKFQVQRLKGVVSRIGLTDADVTAAGERRRFEVGDNLAEGRKLAAPAEDGGE